MSKGSVRRPSQISREEYDRKWEKALGETPQERELKYSNWLRRYNEEQGLQDVMWGHILKAHSGKVVREMKAEMEEILG